MGRPAAPVSEWETRYCDVCDDVIPTTNKDGEPLTKWAHSQRKTCGKTSCFESLQTNNRRKHPKKAESLEAIDFFIRGQSIAK